jgi:hypothetical protein
LRENKCLPGERLLTKEILTERRYKKGKERDVGYQIGRREMTNPTGEI